MRFLLGFLCLIFIIPQSAQAADPLPIEAVDAYAYATASVQKNGAVFVTFKNLLDQNDVRIVKASTNVAERVELHTHEMDGDIMMMREVESYVVPPGSELILEPMGHHIMLMGLKESLKDGDGFDVEVFGHIGDDETQTSITFPVTVKHPGDVEGEMKP